MGFERGGGQWRHLGRMEGVKTRRRVGQWWSEEGVYVCPYIPWLLHFFVFFNFFWHFLFFFNSVFAFLRILSVYVQVAKCICC
jgi:hypothetical protein